MLNVVAFMGRLCADPELRNTPSGVAACAFRIAVERSFCKEGEARKADFIEIVTWRKTAEFVCRYFRKGSLIAVDGSLQTRNYEDKNGNKRTAFEVVANNVHFADSKGMPAKSLAATSGFAPASGSVDVGDYSIIEDGENLPF